MRSSRRGDRRGGAIVAAGIVDYSTVAGSFVLLAGTDVPIFVPEQTGAAFA
jgi:hypothetical protein